MTKEHYYCNQHGPFFADADTCPVCKILAAHRGKPILGSATEATQRFEGGK